MCGIVGYIGKKRKTSFLIDKLKLLEYRGYDSSGYANLNNKKLEVKKCVGGIDNLQNNIEEKSQISCAIAHTRWATHGKVTEINSHPHTSYSEQWTVVHNGIIENYEEILKKLKHKPRSDTDTAVLAQLLEENNVKSIEEFINTFKLVDGSFAISAISKGEKDAMFLAKRRSPLFISQNESKDFLIASDPVCFKDYAKSYYYLEDDEFALIKDKEIKFYDKNAKIIKKDPKILENLFENYGKNGFSSFMLKEIFDESEALKLQVDYYKNSNTFEKFGTEFIRQFNKIKLIGCGTAYHASLIGAKYFQKILKIQATAEYASEFIYSEPILEDDKTLFIFVSQSGETADTIQALNIAKQIKAKTIALTNVLYSTLAKQADIVIPVCAGVEIAVASTKAYVCQLSALYMLACHLSNEWLNNKINFYEDILKISQLILNFKQDKLDDLALSLKDSNQCIFIGKDMDYITAREASLKLKETTYIASTSYPSGELKHGYLALVEEGTPIIAFACQKRINIKTINSVKEAVARGAVPIIFTNSSELSNNFNTIYFEEDNELLLPIYSIAPLQYLACKISELKNINPDKPKNLAKSVTVE